MSPHVQPPDRADVCNLYSGEAQYDFLGRVIELFEHAGATLAQASALIPLLVTRFFYASPACLQLSSHLRSPVVPSERAARTGVSPTTPRDKKKTLRDKKKTPRDKKRTTKTKLDAASPLVLDPDETSRARGVQATIP